MSRITWSAFRRFATAATMSPSPLTMASETRWVSERVYTLGGFWPKEPQCVPRYTSLPCRTDDQVARIVAVNGTHRPPDALAPLVNVRRGADGDKNRHQM